MGKSDIGRVSSERRAAGVAKHLRCANAVGGSAEVAYKQREVRMLVGSNATITVSKDIRCSMLPAEKLQ